MNRWISQFVLGFALAFWPAPLVGFWLLAEKAEPAPETGLVPQSYGPLPDFNPGPRTAPAEQLPEQTELGPELEPEVEPLHAPGSHPVAPGRRNQPAPAPAPQPRPTDGRPPL